MNPGETTDLAEAAKQAALLGGRELLAWRGRFSTREKGLADLVTEADLASQEAIQRLLADRFPDHRFVGEEAAGSDAPPTDHGETPCWVVDPLDGTTNYVHDFPCYAVSVAAVVGGVPVAGAVLDPVRDELFWAGRGLGAWLGDRPLQPAVTPRLGEALIGVSLPAAVKTDGPDFNCLLSLAPRCQAIRRMGSAALNLAYLACGRLDGYVAHKISPWDVAAGVLLVSEAGGLITSPDGSPHDVWRASCLGAGSHALHAALLPHGSGTPHYAAT